MFIICLLYLYYLFYFFISCIIHFCVNHEFKSKYEIIQPDLLKFTLSIPILEM